MTSNGHDVTAITPLTNVEAAEGENKSETSGDFSYLEESSDGFFGAFFFRVRWMADGQSLAYIDRHGGVSNIWAQPLDSNAPRQLTDFHNDQIFDFAFSSDGKRLTIARGAESSDIVLLNDFQ